MLWVRLLVASIAFRDYCALVADSSTLMCVCECVDATGTIVLLWMENHKHACWGGAGNVAGSIAINQNTTA